MHDFNFYTEREIITVLSSRSEIAEVSRRPGHRYLLVKEPDLKTLNMFGPSQILLTRSVGSTTWNLVAF
jgi:hypothetical protein